MPKKLVLTVFTALLLVIAIVACSNREMVKRPVDYVNPLVDTHKSRWIFFSSASRPFGLVNLSPDTETNGTWNSGYIYDSKKVRCFSHIHAWQMSGIPVLPVTGEFKGHKGMDIYASTFSHETEEVVPGYHKVHLDDYGITAELTSTDRTGFHRYTYPASDSSFVIFDTGAYLAHGPVVSSEVFTVNETEIAGKALMAHTRRRPKDTWVYFVARFSKPYEQFGGWVDSTLVAGTPEAVAGKNAGAFVRFSTGSEEQVLMKVGISYTGIEGARLNLDTELPHWDFDRIVDESLNVWDDWLGKIEVEGGTEKQRIKFYTDLWHALQGRRIISDADGHYCDMTGDEPVVRQVKLEKNGTPAFNMHSFDAWWGSHWSLNILWSLAYPHVMEDFCNSMVEMYNNGGLIPRGPSGGNYSFVMIGDPAVSFFACAYAKGIRGWDTEKAYEGLYKNAFPGGIRDRAGYEFGDNPSGGGMEWYVKNGYVPEGLEGNGFHKDGAAMTLEYAYQDWCLAQLAKGLGKDSDYQLFSERSLNYRNIWDPSVGFMRPRMQDGSWLEGFEPVGEGFSASGFCEGNSAIYTHFVPHDIQGLIGLVGGKEKYTEFLNESFEKATGNNFVADHGKHSISWVDYDNQPGTGMAHLFNYSGAPWLSQKWVRLVKEQAHGDITPYGGYHGDEDQGQMGALGALMAMGLFEVRGGCAEKPVYEITSPLFDSVTIHLDRGYYEGEKFVIKTRNNSKDNMYIQSAELNGEPLNNCWFHHGDLAGGGSLLLELGAEPDKNWGVETPPPSLTR